MIAIVGYDLHITRRAEWSDPGSGPPITREEFERVVRGDTRFRLDEGLGPDCAVPVKRTRGGADASSLCWHDGEITTKNPPRSLIRLAVEIAASLNARVIGVDGEEYGEDGRAVGTADDGHDGAASPDDGSDSAMVESDTDMRKRHLRESVVASLQWTGVVLFVAVFVWLLGKQLGWW
jgi:hypothetical protein